jgi:ankyrin repeat protein
VASDTVALPSGLKVDSYHLRLLCCILADTMQSNHQAQFEVVKATPKSQTPLDELVSPTLPLDLEGCRKIGVPVPNNLLSSHDTRELHEYARSKDASDIKTEVSLIADVLQTSPPAVLLIAIDVETGDSLLHTAMRAQRIDFLCQLRDTFPPNSSFAIGSRLLLRHANHQGQTLLHTAVESGSLNSVIAAYRLFADDTTLPTETPHHDYTPVEDETDLPDGGIPHLVFLLSENLQGQTAADFARAAGFEEAASWIEKLDPLGERNDAAKRTEWDIFVTKHYQYRYREKHI